MPRGLAEDGDADMLSREEGPRPPLQVPVGLLTDKPRKLTDAEEQEEAAKWFEEQDRKYYTNTSYVQLPGVPQRRNLWESPLESYIECRRAAQRLGTFLQSIPPHIKEGPELAQWYEEQGWNDITHRNGSRYKWAPGFNLGHRSYWDEEEEQKWKPVIHEPEWFNATVESLIRKAWALPPGANFGAFFRLHNTTMEEVAQMHCLLPDAHVLDLRDHLDQQAGDDEHKVPPSTHTKITLLK